ncbi:MAG: hypothetical protein AB7I27_12570 [Bacteriovoracaceae bacterium]
MKVLEIVEDMKMYYLGEHTLNHEKKIRSKALELIDIFQKNKNLQKDIERELRCYQLTYAYYGSRTEEEIIAFYESKQDKWYENLERELKPICSKYNIHFESLYERAIELQEETKEVMNKGVTRQIN